MISLTKISFVAMATAAVVEGFAPLAQPRFASSTELGAFFFQKPTEKSPTLSLDTDTKIANPFAKFSFGKDEEDEVVAKKAPVKKVVAKKAVAKKVPVKKVVAKKPVLTSVAKKAPVKKVVLKKTGKKSDFKNDFVIKKPEKKTSLTIYERQCHIN